MIAGNAENTKRGYMKVAFHLGAHCTDEDRLLQCLLKNRDTLAPNGVIVPLPGRYRPIFRETLIKLRGQPAGHDVQEILLDAVMDEDRAERLIFSHEYFLCAPLRIVTPEGFYATAGRKVRAFSNLFAGTDCEFHMALRNPATLVPAMLSRLKDTDYEALMNGASPADLRWGEVVSQMIAHNPGLRLVIWCNEDTPMIWPEVLRRVAGVPMDTEMDGDFDLLATLLSPEGLANLRQRMERAGDCTLDQQREIVAVALEEFALPDAMEMDIGLPGWTDDLVSAITEDYEADIDDIARMPGVEFIQP